MSQQFRALVVKVTKGKGGDTKLAAKASVSLSTIRNIKKKGHIPDFETTAKVALACGLDQEDALELAKECASEKLRFTA